MQGESRNQGGSAMLVLSRKVGSSIRIGKDITLTVVKIDRNQVRLGIEAPLNVPILREELVLELPEGADLRIESDMMTAAR
jgi:carbon storage regulator